MKIWVTRAEPGASATAERLRALGHEPLVAPLLTVNPLDAPTVPAFAALAFTSANAVCVFGARSHRRDLPVFTVGDATARAARAAGYGDVRSAEGDVEALAALIIEEQPPGLILHPCAKEPAGDLVGALTEAGLTAQRLAVYETAVATRLPAAAAGAEAVLVHSPRAARALAALMEKGADAIRAYALSPACAAPLTDAGFREIAIAERPDEASLLALV